jgi:hypothetical protein
MTYLARLMRRVFRAIFPTESKSWMSYAGFVQSGNPRSGQSIDEVVYGRKDRVALSYGTTSNSLAGMRR